MSVVRISGVLALAAAVVGQPAPKDPPIQAPPLRNPNAEPDWRSVPMLTPEQQKQQEEDSRKSLEESGLTVSLVGVATIPPNVDGLGRVGGLSGLTHLDGANFLAVSDRTKSSIAYTVTIALTPTDSRDRFSVEPTVTSAPMELDHPSTDSESVAMLPDGGGVVIGYERPPTIALFKKRTDGPWRAEKLPIPESITDEIRHNRAFESVMVRTPASGREIWAATEAAIKTDGPEAMIDSGTRCRVLVFTGRDPEIDRQYIYVTEPRPDGPLDISFNSLAEFCSLPDGRFLALERGFAPLGGFSARIFLLDGSSRASKEDGGLPELLKVELASVRMLGVSVPANLEAMALGPRMAEVTGDDTQKGRMLVLIADENFGSDGQNGSQVVVLRIVGLDKQDAESDDEDAERDGD